MPGLHAPRRPSTPSRKRLQTVPCSMPFPRLSNSPAWPCACPFPVFQPEFFTVLVYPFRGIDPRAATTSRGRLVMRRKKVFLGSLRNSATASSDRRNQEDQVAAHTTHAPPPSSDWRQCAPEPFLPPSKRPFEERHDHARPVCAFCRDSSELKLDGCGACFGHPLAARTSSPPVARRGVSTMTAYATACRTGLLRSRPWRSRSCCRSASALVVSRTFPRDQALFRLEVCRVVSPDWACSAPPHAASACRSVVQCRSGPRRCPSGHGRSPRPRVRLVSRRFDHSHDPGPCARLSVRCLPIRCRR